MGLIDSRIKSYHAQESIPLLILFATPLVVLRMFMRNRVLKPELPFFETRRKETPVVKTTTHSLENVIPTPEQIERMQKQNEKYKLKRLKRSQKDKKSDNNNNNNKT
jgi:hypothetical protein